MRILSSDLKPIDAAAAKFLSFAAAEQPRQLARFCLKRARISAPGDDR
jgi:hypothetical protein